MCDSLDAVTGASRRRRTCTGASFVSSESTTNTAAACAAVMQRSQGDHYIRFSVSPANTGGLIIRKTLQDALLQSFGLTSANVYVDVLWLAEDGVEVIVRVGSRCVLYFRGQCNEIRANKM